MNIQWNANQYANQFQFVPNYGEELFNLLKLKPGMKVLDLGCGTGDLTAKLKQLGAQVVGMDESEEMLHIARNKYPDITFIHGDACTLEVKEKYDAIFSNAVFHWIEDQNLLLDHISRALNKGGALVCEFGGRGCCEIIHNALRLAFKKRGLHYPFSFYFPTIGEYAPIVEHYGLRVVYAVYFDRFTELQGEKGLEDWIEMFNQRPFEGVDKKEKEEIIQEAVESVRPLLYHNGKWYADYVRIRLKAIK